MEMTITSNRTHMGMKLYTRGSPPPNPLGLHVLVVVGLNRDGPHILHHTTPVNSTWSWWGWNEAGRPGPHTHQTAQNLHQATFHMEEEIMPSKNILTNPFIETFQKSRKTRISLEMIFFFFCKGVGGWVGE